MPDNTTAVAQFSVAGGLWQETAERMRVIEQRGKLLARSRDNLYIMIEPVGSFTDPDAVCRLMADRIEETYFGNRGSITARLWAALKAANRELFQDNADAPANERGILGITCALVRGSDVYLMQAGPTLAYIVHKGTVERFPSVSTWLYKKPSEAMEASQTTSVHADAIGWRRDVEPDLYYGHVDKGDLIVLTNTQLVRIATDAEIVAALAAPDANQLRSNLEKLAGRHDLSAIVVQMLNAEGPRPSSAPSRGPAPRTPSAARARDSRLDLVGPAPQAEAAPVAPEAEDKPWTEESAEQPEDWESEEVEEVATGRYTPDWESESAGDAGDKPSTTEAAWDGLRRGVGGLLHNMMPDAAPSARLAPQRLSRRRGGAALKIGLGVAAVILVVAAALLINRRLKQRAYEAELAELVSQAQTQMTAASTGAPESQRVFLGQAMTLVEQVLAQEPAHVQAGALQITITQRLDTVNKVVRVPYVGVLKDFGQDVRPSSPDRLLVKDNDLYALDRASTQVNRYTLRASGEELDSGIAQSMLASVSDSGSPVQVIDIACVQGAPADSADDPRLMVLTRDGAVLESTAAAPNLVSKPIENGRDLTAALAADTYGQMPGLYLYILDPGANLIRKYQVTADRYADAPADYPAPGQTLDLSGGLDIAIDGSIYVLLRNGTILKLVQGELVDFKLEGLDKPLANPVALAVSRPDDMEAGHVFVADAGNQRIVQFDKAGRFVQQWVAATGQPPLDALRDLAVVESGSARRLYMLNGSHLYTMSLP